MHVFFYILWKVTCTHRGTKVDRAILDGKNAPKSDMHGLQWLASSIKLGGFHHVYYLLSAPYIGWRMIDAGYPAVQTLYDDDRLTSRAKLDYRQMFVRRVVIYGEKKNPPTHKLKMRTVLV